MTLDSLNIQNFRNLNKEQFYFHPQLTLIVGENAKGKTSILEAIYFVVYGNGFRETREEELLLWEETQSLVEGTFQTKGQSQLFQVTLHNRDSYIEKKYYVNKAAKSHYLYLNHQTRAVLFSPEHILIIIGSPDRRRDYLNRVICAYDVEYQKRLRNYDNALRKRNKILETHYHSPNLDEELVFWNEYLEEQAAYITKKREEYINALNKHPNIDSKKFRIEYRKNEFNRIALLSVEEKEKRYRKTLIGPQKDDFVVYLKEGSKEENVHLFGSRSEQRLAVFWLKINEIDYLEEKFHIKPLLLLDDIFSELDQKNKKMVLGVIERYQTIATTTEADLPELTHLPKSVIKL